MPAILVQIENGGHMYAHGPAQVVSLNDTVKQDGEMGNIKRLAEFTT